MKLSNKTQQSIIFYSIAGEGRGHATRAQTVIDYLRSKGHHIHAYAGGQAYELLMPVYQQMNDVIIKKIPYIRWQYKHNRVHFFNTAASIFPFFLKSKQWIDSMCRDIQSARPALIISDFESLMPRAANKMKVPLISLDHQHFLLTSDFSDLPKYIRWYASMMTIPVRITCPGKRHAIISSFFTPKLKPKYQNSTSITIVGTLIRPQVQALKRTQLNSKNQGHHIICYIRKFLEPNVKTALLNCGRPVHIYGLGEHPQENNLIYKTIDLDDFIKDLAQADALCTTAGNQLLGEALYLNKPVLALPEIGNQEQAINAHYLNQMEVGCSYPMHTLDTEKMQDFIANINMYRSKIVTDAYFGNQEVFSTIERFLQPVNINASLDLHNSNTAAKGTSCEEPYPIAMP